MSTDAAEASTAVALRPSGHLQIDDGQEFWSREQIAALGVLGIKNATNGDLSVFFHYCRRTALDPFSRQIYMISRRTKERWQDESGQWREQWVMKQTIQVGIDGFRVVRDRVAERTGYVCDFEDTVWYDADGGEHGVWLSADAPAACRVVLVKRQKDGMALRFPAVLRTASYMQVNSRGEPLSQWKTQPEHMIEKCCEAFATRRAFPNDFSGVYLEDEIAGRAAAETGEQPAARRPVTVAEIMADDEPAADQPEPEPAEAGAPDTGEHGTVSKDQLDALWTEFTRLGFGKDDRAEYREVCERVIGRKLLGGTTGNLSADEADRCLAVAGRFGERGDVVAFMATGEVPAAAGEAAQ